MIDAALSKMAILVWGEPIEKEDAIRRLLDACPAIDSGFGESAWASILEREQQGGTLVGEDVVIPHARIQALSQPLMDRYRQRGNSGAGNRTDGPAHDLAAILCGSAGKSFGNAEMISKIVRDDSWRKDVLASQNAAKITKAVQNYWSIRFQVKM